MPTMQTCKFCCGSIKLLVLRSATSRRTQTLSSSGATPMRQATATQISERHTRSPGLHVHVVRSCCVRHAPMAIGISHTNTYVE